MEETEELSEEPRLYITENSHPKHYRTNPCDTPYVTVYGIWLGMLLRSLSSRNSQSNDALIQLMIRMMNGFENTINELNTAIKELCEEIKRLKERPASLHTEPHPPTNPAPARPHAWNNPSPKQNPRLTPKQPPKNSEINNLKAATLIIHETLGTEPFKGLKTSKLFREPTKLSH
ncbi:hypothetical protein DFH28DRAFT_1120707 [Melampsora americana]|nr:hypothetical protein DFH28DRAFT_1120707 [Melampsora americana]